MESGTRLGPYEILEQLGAGGMGEPLIASDEPNANVRIVQNWTHMLESR